MAIGARLMCLPSQRLGVRFFGKKQSRKSVGQVSVQEVLHPWETDAPQEEPEEQDVEVDMEEYLKKYYRYMGNVAKGFGSTLGGVRLGRATPDMFDHILVSAYGDKSPFKSVATVALKSPQLVMVQPHDPSLLKEVQKALEEANPDWNAVEEGRGVAVHLPKVTAEIREQMIKNVGKMSEKAKIRVRYFRKIAMEKLDKMKREEDETFRLEKQIQIETDKAVKEIETLYKQKVQELSTSA